MLLIVCGSTEDLLPKFCGVGFPLLLAVTAFFTAKMSLAVASLFAVVAGSFEDALSSLPAATSVFFFLAVALLNRQKFLPQPFMFFVFPVYQLWLEVWSAELIGSFSSRMLISVPCGLVTFLVVFLFFKWFDHLFFRKLKKEVSL